MSITAQQFFIKNRRKNLDLRSARLYAGWPEKANFFIKNCLRGYRPAAGSGCLQKLHVEMFATSVWKCLQYGQYIVGQSVGVMMELSKGVYKKHVRKVVHTIDSHYYYCCLRLNLII